MKIRFFLALIAILNAPCIGLSQNGGQPSEVYNLIVNYDADFGSLSRFYFYESPERRERFKKFYTDYLTSLNNFQFSSLSMGGKVDYLLMKRNFEANIERLTKEEAEYKQIEKYVSIGQYIYSLENLRRRGISLNGEEVAIGLDKIARSVQSAHTNLSKEGSLSASLANRAEETIKGQQQAIKSVYEFYRGYDPLFTWWVQAPYKTLDSLLSIYAKAIKAKTDKSKLPKDDGSGIIGNPIGREEIIKQLRFEMIPYSPEELIDMANKEFAWCDKELLKASQEMGFGDRWKDAQEKVKQSFVPPGKQPEAMLKLYNESIDFLKKMIY